MPTPNLNLSNLFGGNHSAVGGSNYGSGLEAVPGTEARGERAGGRGEDRLVSPITIPPQRAPGRMTNEAWASGAMGSPIMPSQQPLKLQSQNFYPPQAQSRLSQKSAIVDLTTPQHTDSGRHPAQTNASNDYE